MRYKLGLHEGTVIDSSTISIEDQVFHCENHFSPGDNLSVLYTVGDKFIPIEKITPAILDEATVRKNLDYDLVFPASGEVCSLFGPRRSPVHGGDEFHEGLDISNAVGTPVVSAADGVVDEIKEDDHYGRHIVVRHPGDLLSIYAHLDKATVETGNAVFAGQPIGEMGDTGKSSGPHLHFGLKYFGKDLNPRAFFDRQIVRLGNTVEAGHK